MGFPDGSAGKESACNVGDLGSIPGVGRSTGEGNSYPLQHSGLENSMDCIVHGVTKSWTRLSDFHFLACKCDHVRYVGYCCCCYATAWKRKWIIKYVFLIKKCQWVFQGEKVDGADWGGCVVLVGGQGCKDRWVLGDEGPSMDP